MVAARVSSALFRLASRQLVAKRYPFTRVT